MMASQQIITTHTYDASAAFEEFWNLYPRKRGNKPGTKKKYIKKINTLKKHLLLMEELQDQIESKMICRNDPYTPYASTWFNQERWTDEIEVKRETSRPDSPKLGVGGRIRARNEQRTGNVYDHQ